MILYIYLKKVCIQSVFICKVLLFFHALYLFVYSTSLCFSSSRRFLYCSQRCFCYFFSLLKKDFDTFHKALFEAFPGIFNEISLTNRQTLFFLDNWFKTFCQIITIFKKMFCNNVFKNCNIFFQKRLINLFHNIQRRII